MTATTTGSVTNEPTATTPARLGGDRDAAIPFGRLVRLELRKLVDTRAGRVLLLITGLLLVGVQVIGMLVGDSDSGKDLSDFLQLSTIPLQLLLPLVGILAVTSEWSQRTGLVTFTLEPRRVRVALAKWTAAIALAVAGALVGSILAVLFTGLTDLVRGSGPQWGAGWQLWLGVFVGLILQVSIGVAFGMLIQNTPGAIVAFFVIPTLWSMLGQFSWMSDIARWASTDRTLAPLYNGEMSGADWPRLGVSLLIWLVVPMAAGIWRMTHSEVKSA